MKVMAENNPIFNPEDIIKKEARGINNTFLGQVQEIHSDFIVTEKGTVETERFHFPKNLFDRHDGHNVWFRVTEEEAKQYKKD
jgi:hypothetical protein